MPNLKSASSLAYSCKELHTSLTRLIGNDELIRKLANNPAAEDKTIGSTSGEQIALFTASATQFAPLP